MNLTHTGLHRFSAGAAGTGNWAGLLIRRPRYRLLCGDCGFCMGACRRAVKEASPGDGSGALSL